MPGCGIITMIKNHDDDQSDAEHGGGGGRGNE
jgi:hypothetical protein